METFFYKHDENSSFEESRKKLETAIKALPQNAVLFYPRGEQFIQCPGFGGHVTKEWLTKNRLGKQAPLCGTPLVISTDQKIPNSFPATELYIVTILGGGPLFKKNGLGNELSLQRSDQEATENALLKKKIEQLEKKINELELETSGGAGEENPLKK